MSISWCGSCGRRRSTTSGCGRRSPTTFRTGRSASGIAAELHTSGLLDDRLASEVETALYRIAQEALNNVAKHSRARRVEVILERRPDCVLLIVEDDGVGFDAARTTAADRQGFGLVGMQERAALVGATLRDRIDARQGHDHPRADGGAAARRHRWSTMPDTDRPRLRILLADDHVTVRHGLKLLIDGEPDMKVVAEASDGEAAMQQGAGARSPMSS